MKKLFEMIKKTPGQETKDLVPVKENKTVSTPVDRKKIVEYMDAFGLSANLTPEETSQFVEVATAYQLNPFKREIHCVKYMKNVKQANGNWEKEPALSIITGYEVYLKRADRTGKCNGWSVWTEGAGNSVVAKVEIHRKDWSTPFKHEVAFSEYNQGNKIWKDKPLTMIKKVVVAQGFRMAFPDEMGGMPYTSDELPDEMTKTYEGSTEGAKDSVRKPASKTKPPKPAETETEFTVEEPATKNNGPLIGKQMEVPRPKGDDPCLYKEEPPEEPIGVDPPTNEPKGEETCMFCGTLLIKGKEQYGGGWICWTKKNGCGSKFDDNLKLKKNGVTKEGALKFFDKFKGRVVNCPLDDELFKICDGYGWDIKSVEHHFGMAEQPVDIMTGTEEVSSEKVPEIFPVTPEPGTV